MVLLKPRLVLRTADLERSLSFYRDQLGCTEEWCDPERAVARVRLPGGSMLLLAAASVDVTDLVDPGAREQPRTTRLYVLVPDVRVLHRKLAEQGAPVISFTDDPYDPILLAEDPDGYLKFALAEPGREYRGNPVTVPDLWVAGLDYAHRPIAAEVALFRVMREHMGALVEHLDGALERAVLNGQGGRSPVRGGLRLAATHAWSHIQQIRETRAVARV
ncbi:MAG TPA: VOC family protein [Symbiobacteriaceae bacterium]|nr:VOC family protein [Symbiobacteriaceae bacterium]